MWRSTTSRPPGVAVALENASVRSGTGGFRPGLGAFTPLLGIGDWIWPSVALAAVGIVAIVAWAIVRIVRDVREAGTEIARTGSDAAMAVADRLTGALRSAFNVEPRVVIDGTTRHHGAVSARELVTVRQQLTRRHDWTQTRLWSTKTVSLTATFTVKAGFDLSQPIEVRVAASPLDAEVRWPAARILSVQIDQLHPADESHGWWNRVSAADRAIVQAEMQRRIEADAAKSGLLARAEAELQELLRQQAGPAGGTVHLEFGPDHRSLPHAS